MQHQLVINNVISLCRLITSLFPCVALEKINDNKFLSNLDVCLCVYSAHEFPKNTIVKGAREVFLCVIATLDNCLDSLSKDAKLDRTKIKALRGSLISLKASIVGIVRCIPNL